MHAPGAPVYSEVKLLAGQAAPATSVTYIPALRTPDRWSQLDRSCLLPKLYAPAFGVVWLADQIRPAGHG
jgi:hypothetical protein